MSVLTGKPSSLAINTTSGTITLSRSTLISQMSITDPYWSDSTNWQQVFFQYQDNTGSQHRSLTFGASNTATFFISAHAMQNTWQAKSIIIIDYDGGTYSIPRASFTSASEFDIIVNNGSYSFGTGDLRPSRVTPWSISLWIKPIGTVSGAQTLFDTLDATAPERGITCARYTGERLLIALSASATGGDLILLQSPLASITTSAYTHVVFTYSGSTVSSGIKCYLNGVLTSLSTFGGSGSVAGEVIGTNTVRVGAYADISQFPNTYMSQLLFYRGLELSSGQVTELFGGGTTVNPSLYSSATSAVLYLKPSTTASPADVATGTIYDRTSNHNGTTVGTSGAFIDSDNPGGYETQSMHFNGSSTYLTLA